MAPFEGPSYEPEQENITGGEGTSRIEGQSAGDDLNAQYQRLLDLTEKQVSDFSEGTGLKALAQEEQDELKTKFEGSRSESMKMSEYQRNDLAEEFGEDIRALNVLKRDYESHTGYPEFITLLNSSQIREVEKEKLYDLLAREPDLIEEFIDDDLDGEMFPDAVSIQDMLAGNSMDIEKDEINEVLDKDISESTESELAYLDLKIYELITQGVSKSFESRLSRKKDEISIKKQSLVISNTNQLEDTIGITATEVTEATRADTEATRADTEATRADTEATTADTEATTADTEATTADTEATRADTEAQKEHNEEIENTRTKIETMVNLINSQDLNISDTLRGLLNAATAESADVDMMEQTQREVRNFFKNDPTQISDLLKQAHGKGPEVLRQTQQFLGALAQGNPEFEALLNNTLREIGMAPPIGGSEVREAQATAYFGDEAIEVSDIEIDGQTYTLDDLQIDASDTPPRAYVLGEDGLQLELGLPDMPNDSETLAARREFAQTQIALSSELQEISGEYKEKQGKLDRLKQLEQAKIHGERLHPDQEKELLSLREEKPQLEKDVTELTSQIEGIYAQASNASKAFEKNMSELQFDYEKIQKQQETARFSLKLMKSFGIDRIGQDRFNQMIAEVQNGQLIVDIESPNGFDPQKIDLAAGTFGEIQGEAGGENFRENLVRFVNLMYFGNPEGKNEEGKNEEGKNEEGTQIGMNVEIFKRVSQIENIPGQDPNLVSRMQGSNILTSAGDLNVDKARDNLNNNIE